MGIGESFWDVWPLGGIVLVGTEGVEGECGFGSGVDVRTGRLADFWEPVRCIFVCFFVVFAISAPMRFAKAQNSSGNFISYQCDIRHNQLTIAYDEIIDGPSVSYNMNSLVGSDGPDFIHFETIPKRCALRSGIYDVEIHASGWPNVQGECGGEGPTGGVTVMQNKKQLVDLDFDRACVGNFPAVSKVIISGPAGDVQIIKAQTIDDH